MIDQEQPRQLPRRDLLFQVSDWFAWAPERETRNAWRAWAGQADAAADDASMPALPMMLRRRVTPIGQKALGAAMACSSVTEARYVLASRHGEFDRTVTVLNSLAQGEQPSPAEFSMSVHHGLAGLLSIHTGNRAGHTAVAGSLDSFGYGLVEAVSCLVEAPMRPVMLIYFDAPLPSAYAPFRAGAEVDLPLVLAMTLSAPAGDALSVSANAGADEDESQENLPLSFLRFLLGARPTATARGGRMTWRWDRVQ
ncbi:beta-ketoacyl synthase chain length factor [Dongia rigui]|uniref:Beta-ketoacyl synthase chain length factor n=1 Tax=Dongia rigui TaxID=940149 RepID=A0ABU5E1E1_9PROT|nr:beta-ketoacyl synthase chain length factor [Dongia rigui]MDY0873324.1 beta-ketoacyl synthase chain length factor [Dongia rigui]